MPVKAGIQNLLILNNLLFSKFCHSCGGRNPEHVDFYWISASAGMTKCGFKNILYFNKL